jgi:CBS-domain-containing membrane protein
MKQSPPFESSDLAAPVVKAGEIELSDADILEAMAEIPGYLDISTADFRDLYHLAYRHGLERLFRGISARRLMRADIQPLAPDMRLVEAIPHFVRQGLKALPVADAEGRVTGILSETDVLRALGAETFLALLARLMAEPGLITPNGCQRSVRDLMTSPAVTVPETADFLRMMGAFGRHPGRAMPVVSADGRLVGLLLRKQFLHACHLAAPAPP